MRYHLQTVLGYTEDRQINHWYKKETKRSQGFIHVEHRQEHHSRTNVDYLEQLFVSATLRNQLKFLEKVDRSRFALIYE